MEEKVTVDPILDVAVPTDATAALDEQVRDVGRDLFERLDPDGLRELGSLPTEQTVDGGQAETNQ